MNMKFDDFLISGDILFYVVGKTRFKYNTFLVLDFSLSEKQWNYVPLPRILNILMFLKLYMFLKK